MAVNWVHPLALLNAAGTAVAAAGSWTAIALTGNLFLRGAAAIDITDDASTLYILDAQVTMASPGTVQFRVYDIGAAAAVLTTDVNQTYKWASGPLSISATDKRWRFEYQGTAAIRLYGIAFVGVQRGNQM